MATTPSQSDPQSEPKEPKLCSSCGRPKDLLHYQDCRRNRTADIIAKVNTLLETHPSIRDEIKGFSQHFLKAYRLTWEELATFPHLAPIGCDEVGIHWCHKSFELFDQTEPFQEKVTILDNIIAILFCYDMNSRVQPVDNPCSTCGKSRTECLQARQDIEQSLKSALTSRIEFPPAIETKIRETTFGMTHLAFNMFRMLLGTFDANREDTRAITARQICRLIIEFIEYAEFQKLLGETDKLIDG